MVWLIILAYLVIGFLILFFTSPAFDCLDEGDKLTKNNYWKYMAKEIRETDAFDYFLAAFLWPLVFITSICILVSNIHDRSEHSTIFDLREKIASKIEKNIKDEKKIKDEE